MPNVKTGSHRSLPDPTAHALATALRTHRTTAGLTQEGLASKAGVSVQLVRRLEAATANPTLGTLYAVTAAMDISWSELLVEIER